MTQHQTIIAVGDIPWSHFVFYPGCGPGNLSQVTNPRNSAQGPRESRVGALAAKTVRGGHLDVSLIDPPHEGMILYTEKPMRKSDIYIYIHILIYIYIYVHFEQFAHHTTMNVFKRFLFSSAQD